MSQRDKLLIELRPFLPAVQNISNGSLEENFQNETLRPIAKLQNEILISVFKNYILKHKNKFYTLTNKGKIQYVENAVKNDHKLRNMVKGLFIGLFSEDEFTFYAENTKYLNKRITNLVVERLVSQIQVFREE